jgi:hypothetical protein
MVAALINQPIKPDQTAPTAKTNTVDPQGNAVNPAVGPGVTGASPTTSVPPVAGAPGDLGAAFASLLKFLPAHDDAEVRIAIAMSKLSEMQQKGDNEQIKVEFSKRAEVSAAKLKAAKDMEDQLKKVEGTGFWDVIKVVCEVIVVALAVVAACTGVGAGLSALLITALWMCAGAGAAALADEAATAYNGHGVLGNMVLFFGGSEEDAKTVDLIHSIVQAVVQIVAGIVLMCAGDPEQEHAGWARLALAVGSATATVGAGYVNWQNSDHRADSMRARAREELAQAEIERLDQAVQLTIKRMTTNLGNWGQIRDELMGTLADRNYQTARVRFA